MSAIASTRERIAGLLAGAGVVVERDANGDVYAHHGSATVYVHVRADDAGAAIADVWSPVLADVAVTPALLRHVAETSYLLGRLVVERGAGGAGQLVMTHALLGETIDLERLMAVMGAIVTTTDRIDDELQARFGGRRAADPPGAP